MLNLNDKLSLADKASIVADDGETSELPITWLNANGVDITTPVSMLLQDMSAYRMIIIVIMYMLSRK